MTRVGVLAVGVGVVFAAVALPPVEAGSAGPQAGLPLWLDACAYLTQDDVEAVVGAPMRRLGPEDGLPGDGPPEAGYCQYVKVGGSGFGVSVSLWTRTSVELFGAAFDADAGFEISPGSETPLAGAPVAGLGERAVFGTGDVQDVQLVMRDGDLRFRLSASTNEVTSEQAQDPLTTLARRILERIATTPPPPHPLLPVDQLILPDPQIVFGGGRLVHGRRIADGRWNVGTTQLAVGPRVDRILSLDPTSDAPGELDLRDLAISRIDSGLVAVLNFFRPVQLLSELHGKPVTHEIRLVLRSPDGAKATVVLRGDGTTIVQDRTNQVSVADVQAVVAGPFVVFTIPADLGVTAHWTVHPEVDIHADGPFFPQLDVTGWVTRMPAVVIGGLTGEHPGEIPLGGQLYSTAVALASEFQPVHGPLRPRSARLGVDGDRLDLIMAFDEAPTLGGPPGSGGTLGFELIPPVPQGDSLPVTVSLSTELCQGCTGPLAAVVRVEDRALGSVPFEADGTSLRFHLSEYQTYGPTAAPPDSTGKVLGVDEFAFHLNVPFDDPIDGHRVGYDGVTVQIAGPAIALTLDSVGIPAIGFVDPVTTEFAAANGNEAWAGTFGGGGFFLASYTTIEPRAGIRAGFGFSRSHTRGAEKPALKWKEQGENCVDPDLLEVVLSGIDVGLSNRVDYIDLIRSMSGENAFKPSIVRMVKGQIGFWTKEVAKKCIEVFDWSDTLEQAYRQGQNDAALRVMADPSTSSGGPGSLRAAPRPAVAPPAQATVELTRIPFGPGWLVCPFAMVGELGGEGAQTGAPCVQSDLLADFPEPGATVPDTTVPDATGDQQALAPTPTDLDDDRPGGWSGTTLAVILSVTAAVLGLGAFQFARRRRHHSEST